MSQLKVEVLVDRWPLCRVADPVDATAPALAELLVQHWPDVGLPGWTQPRVAVVGELCEFTVSAITDALGWLSDTADELVLDLSGVRLLDAAGVAMLDALRTRMIARDARLVLTRPSEAACRTLLVEGRIELVSGGLARSLNLGLNDGVDADRDAGVDDGADAGLNGEIVSFTDNLDGGEPRQLPCSCGERGTHVVLAAEPHGPVLARTVCATHLAAWLDGSTAAVAFPISDPPTDNGAVDDSLMVLVEPTPDVVAAGVTAHALPVAILFADTTARALYVNPAWCELSGQTVEQSQGDGWRKIFPAAESGLVSDFLTMQPRTHHQRSLTVRTELNDGTTWVLVDGRPLLDAADRAVGWVLSVSDISEVKRLEDQLEYRATHDPLTGVLNRAATLEFLQRVVARSQRSHAPLAVMFIDLDDFKAVNDRWGHDYGDEVLVQVSRRFEKALRPSDVLGRYGGDEFLAVCADLEEGAAARIATRLIDALERPLLLAGTELHITASVGIATLNDPLEDAATLVVRADRAMYQAKHREQGFFVAEDRTNGAALDVADGPVDVEG